MNTAFDRLSTPAASSIKLEAAMADKQHSLNQSHNGQPQQQGAEGRPYYGKCQYKTGKCFNERTLKRNGEVHSLCEEHRIKQNLIQRRSDRKYQTVHAIRRRERSQRRAVLKKQVSMAVAQQLFYEHQQQKTMGIQLATTHTPHAQNLHHPQLPSLSTLAGSSSSSSSVASLAPPIQIPGKMDHSSFNSAFLSSAEGLASPILSFSTPSAFANSRCDEDEVGESDDEDMEIKREPVKSEDGTPTGIDDFTPDSFLNICCPEETADAFASFIPILTARAERQLWTEDDIDFLQTLLLA